MARRTETEEHLTEGKALEANELSSGDLLLKGYAVRWRSEDRDGETFKPGALKEAIPKFLSTAPALVWHHQKSKPLGRVLSLTPDKTGVYMTARLDKQEKNSPFYWIYSGVRKGTIRSLSIGGKFLRSKKGLIDKVRELTEISITSTPVDPFTSGLVVEEQKALNEYVGLSDIAFDLKVLTLENRVDKVKRVAELRELRRSLEL